MNAIKWAPLLCRVPPWEMPVPSAHYTFTTTWMERVCPACLHSAKGNTLRICLCRYIGTRNLYPDVISDNADLNVVLRVGPRTTTLWWLSGNHAEKWHHGEVTVGRVPVDFNILFEASRSFIKPGHVAIDDVFFTNCTSPGKPPARWLFSPAFTVLMLIFFVFIYSFFLIHRAAALVSREYVRVQQQGVCGAQQSVWLQWWLWGRVWWEQLWWDAVIVSSTVNLCT